MRFFQITPNGFAAASEALGKLSDGLLAIAIGLPEMFGVRAVSAIEILAAVFAFVLLPTFVLPVLFDLFRTAKKHNVFTGFDPV